MEYAFKDTNTGKIVRYDMKISEYDAFKAKNPHLERYHETAPGFMDGDAAGPSGFKSKLDGGFKEVLSKVAEAHPTSSVAQKHGKKSIKQSKTEQIVKKHLG